MLFLNLHYKMMSKDMSQRRDFSNKLFSKLTVTVSRICKLIRAILFLLMRLKESHTLLYPLF